MTYTARILWITIRYPPLSGGMAVSSARQVEGLRRRGALVDVIAFTRPEDPVSSVHTEHRDGGTEYHLSGGERYDQIAQQAWQIVSRETVRSPYTYVVGFGAAWPGFLAVTFAAWLNRPALVSVRGNDFDQAWFDARRGLWVKEALSRATVIGVVAPAIARRIEALYPEQDVRFLPNGIDPSTWTLLPGDRVLRDETRAALAADGRAVVGLFGELKYKKGVAFWLGALRDAGLMDRVALLVVGKRIDQETLQVLDDPVLAPPNVRLSYADRDRLPGLYAACDFVAMPSLYEGMPNVLLETMAMGIVPIVSDAGAMGELVRDGETGFIFPVLDRRAAAEATARALNLRLDERTAVGERAREFVARNFSLEKETDALCEVLLARSDHGPGPAA